MSKVLRFPYVAQPFKDPKTNKEKEIFRPLIPIRISCKNQFFKPQIDALVDSGCDTSLFPGWILEKGMGLSLKSGTKLKEQVGIKGEPMDCYVHKVKLYVKKQSFKTTIEFSSDYNFIPLLGRNSFFRLFDKIIFREKEKELELIL